MASELTVLTHMLDRIAREQPPVARLHARQPARRDRRGRRVLPRLSHLRRRGRLDAGRSRASSNGRSHGRAGAIRRWKRRCSTSSARSCCPATSTATRCRTTAVAATRRRRQEEARERLRFAMKLQQYTGPVQAKGLEDTAFYRHNVLISSTRSAATRRVRPLDCRVPRRRGAPPARLAVRDAGDGDARHQARRGRARAHQRHLGAARRVDARRVALDAHSTRALRTVVEAEPAPDRNDEYRFYQALVGCWPLDLPASTPEAPPDARRAPPGIHAEGGPGSQGPHQLADPEPGVRGRAQPVRRARAHREPEARGSCR